MSKVFFWLLLLSILLIIFRGYYIEWLSKRKHHKELVGTYKIDIERTKFGVYEKDTVVYKNLVIAFNNNRTFSMNMQVPFIYDTIGRWSVTGTRLDKMNSLYFQGLDYSNLTSGSPFSQIHYNNGDTIFYMLTPRPKKGSKYLQRVYFKRIR